jgi:cytochrome P450
MRLTPASPSEMNREVRPGGITINGEQYPAGVIVGAASWSQTRSSVYRDPYIFRPERWIVDEVNGVTEESIALLRSNYHPFARGPGSCPGRNMALLELMLAVAKTLHRLDVRKAPGDTLGQGSPDQQWGQRDCNILQIRNAYISLLEGPMLQFRKREN